MMPENIFPTMCYHHIIIMLYQTHQRVKIAVKYHSEFVKIGRHYQCSWGAGARQWSATCVIRLSVTLQWRHNEHDGVSNHQPHHCLPKRLFRRRSKEAPKLRVTGLCGGNSPVTSEFPAQRASNAENVTIWWRHHAVGLSVYTNSSS